jgi:hypothetical protein
MQKQQDNNWHLKLDSLKNLYNYKTYKKGL